MLRPQLRDCATAVESPPGARPHLKQEVQSSKGLAVSLCTTWQTVLPPPHCPREPSGDWLWPGLDLELEEDGPGGRGTWGASPTQVASVEGDWP